MTTPNDMGVPASPSGSTLQPQAASASIPNAWMPIETAPAQGLVQLAVEDSHGERRVFAAEQSHGESESYWLITTGWHVWARLHRAWSPIGWQSLCEPPTTNPKE